MARVNAGAIGVWQTIAQKAFSGNQRIMRGKPRCTASTGVPVHAAKVGTLNWDVTNSDAYICTVATGTWVKLNA